MVLTEKEKMVLHRRQMVTLYRKQADGTMPDARRGEERRGRHHKEIELGKRIRENKLNVVAGAGGPDE